jgi:glucokinase
MTRCHLAADIGGTKTAVALYEEGGTARNPACLDTLASAQFGTLRELICHVLAEAGDPRLERVSLAVAGPVIGGRAQLTNLPWAVDQDELRDALDADSVTLLNDVEAVAHTLTALQADQLAVIQTGRPDPDGTLAVVAPGTGLGMAALVRSEVGEVAVTSEGGHHSFSPINDRQLELLEFLWREHDHVSFERVCSGNLGVGNLYRFLRDTGRAGEPEWLARQLEQADDPTAVIFTAAAEGRSQLCSETVQLFLETLGVAAANLALTVLATGGVFLGGGIPPRIVDTIRSSGLLPAFRAKGRFADLLARAPVHVITDPHAALWGAARHVLGTSASG